jgi:hypothetical protein
MYACVCALRGGRDARRAVQQPLPHRCLLLLGVGQASQLVQAGKGSKATQPPQNALTGGDVGGVKVDAGLGRTRIRPDQLQLLRQLNGRSNTHTRPTNAATTKPEYPHQCTWIF